MAGRRFALLGRVLDFLKFRGESGDGLLFGSPPEYGWHDIIGAPQEPIIAANRPAWAEIASSGVYTWSFGLNEYQSYLYHIPHDYVPGTDIHFHTHWFGPQTAGGYTKWQYDFLYAKGHNQGAFPTTATQVSVEQQQSTTAYQHMIAESAGVTIPGLEVDGLVILKVTRVAPAGTDVVGDVFVPCVDIHYQSTGIPTANRAPDFYV